MAASLNRVGFVSLHVPYGQAWAQDLAGAFRFQPFAVRETPRLRQLALRRGSAVFVLNERLAPGPAADLLYDADPRPALGTASNVCFEVDDVPGLCERLRSRGCSLRVPPTRVQDDGGSVTYGVASSVVGNVSHTLLDRSHYRGPFLPGFQALPGAPPAGGDGVEITHFDHITCVCSRGRARAALDWYERCFGFQRFQLNPRESVSKGYAISGHGVGMLLLALQSAGGSPALPSHGCKLILAESLSEDGANQVDTFLEQHGGAGIQHVGLYSPAIVRTTRALRQAGVRFFMPPATYYSQEDKKEEIWGAGEDPQVLAELGILLDATVSRDAAVPRGGEKGPAATSEPSFWKKYLMQIFTRPIFPQETFFLELIERRGAPGFGEANIRALWKAVQVHMAQQEQG
ncbi:HPDL protein, partial [Eudromia elegans]|nr:HPDL protein [Eudromia elegans]